MSTTGICEVIITGPTGDLLHDLGRELVATRLAASANIWTSPIHSVYWWQGKIETATETRMHLLTRIDLIERLIAFVRERHPYEVPNITAVPIIVGDTDFIDWVKNETVAGKAAL